MYQSKKSASRYEPVKATPLKWSVLDTQEIIPF